MIDTVTANNHACARNFFEFLWGHIIIFNYFFLLIIKKSIHEYIKNLSPMFFSNIIIENSFDLNIRINIGNIFICKVLKICHFIKNKEFVWYHFLYNL